MKNFKEFEYLTPRESTILSMRWGLAGKPPQTLEEVGKRFGVTRARIRQIEQKGLIKVGAFTLKGLQDETK